MKKYTKYVDSKIFNTVIFYSNKFNIDKNLIFALIHVESNFKIKAKSKKNAKGLMQLLDSTFFIYCNKKPNKIPTPVGILLG